jgi:hypothetical protein
MIWKQKRRKGPAGGRQRETWRKRCPSLPLNLWPTMDALAVIPHNGVCEHNPRPLTLLRDARISADLRADPRRLSGPGDAPNCADLYWLAADRFPGGMLSRTSAWCARPGLVRRDGGWRIASYHNSPAS